ncbi:MAG: S41 family peptidase [Bacillota bacterium]
MILDRRRFWHGYVIGFASVLVLLFVGLLSMIGYNYQNIGRAVKVVSLIQGEALQPVDMAKLIEGGTKGAVESLGDPYSAYLEPRAYEQLQAHISGSYGGIGLLISAEEGRITVVSPFKASPAHRAGIISGDEIVRIDTRDTSGMDLETAAALLKGKPATRVVLEILRKGEKTNRKFTLTREVIKLPSVEARFINDKKKLGYLSISNFTEATVKELERSLNQLQGQGLKGLVLDLRNNPGGSLQAAVQVAEKFVPKGPVVYTVDRSGTIPFMGRGGTMYLPLVVLVNVGSASASEIVAGAIKDTDSGTIVGETTFGKGLVQTVFMLDGGAAIKLTTAKYLTPAKKDINKKGIEPDFAVPLDPERASLLLLEDPDPQKDPQLRKAVEILEQKINTGQD